MLPQVKPSQFLPLDPHLSTPNPSLSHSLATRRPRLATALLTPLLATLTKSHSRNSFAYHSYEKTPGVGGVSISQTERFRYETQS